MKTILVVGATGQLGMEVCRRLAGPHRVKALVRPGSDPRHLEALRVECVIGDLKDGNSLELACKDVDTVVATATVVFPRRGDSFIEDEEHGYRNLIAACERQGVKDVIYVSLATPLSELHCRESATYRAKAFVERLLTQSALRHCVVRCGPFMDDYFALIGSRIPLRGERAATLNRARGLTRAYQNLCGNSIERWGIAVVPGPAARRHAFVAVTDVATCIAAAIERASSREVIELGGPEALAWADVVALYEELLGRSVRTLSVPPALIGIMARFARPWSTFLANQLAILRILAVHDTSWLSARNEAGTTSARSYLAAKLGCPA